MIERAALVGCDMIGLVTLDFVLGIVRRGVMHIPLVVEVTGVDGDDRARHPAGLGVPGHMIADPETSSHRAMFPLFEEERLSAQPHRYALGHARYRRE